MSIKGCFNQENIIEQKSAQIELGENVYDKNVRKRVVIEQIEHKSVIRHTHIVHFWCAG